jgi:hypothetical protein
MNQRRSKQNILSFKEGNGFADASTRSADARRRAGPTPDIRSDEKCVA